MTKVLGGMEKKDLMVSATRALVGAVPFAGQALVEIVNHAIPNQRKERVVAYIEMLQRIFSEDQLKKFQESQEKVALIEEGMLAVGFTPQKDRLERITNVIANGLSEEEINADYQSTLIRLAKELSGAEAIILEFYGLSHVPYNMTNNKKMAYEFQERHREIWLKMPETWGSDDENSQQQRNQWSSKMEKLQIYESHLTSLSLLEPNYRHDLSKFDHDLGDLNGVEKSVNELKDVVEELRDVPNNQITQLGIDVLAAIKQPKVKA